MVAKPSKNRGKEEMPPLERLKNALAHNMPVEFEKVLKELSDNEKKECLDNLSISTLVQRPKIFKTACAHGLDLEVCCELQGAQLLTLALQQDYFDVAQLLIENGAGVNFNFKHKGHFKTPLMVFVEAGETGLVKLALGKEARLNYGVGGKWVSDYVEGLKNGPVKEEIMRLIVGRAEENKAHFIEALKNDDFDAAVKYVLLGVPLSDRFEITINEVKHELLPLEYAAITNKVKMLTVIAKAIEGQTMGDDGDQFGAALTIALGHEFYQAACLLHESGANPSARYENGSTVFMKMAGFGKPLGLKFLLKFGAKTCLRDKNGKGPLDYAQEAVNQETITFLQELNKKLSEAIEHDDQGAVREALEQGADFTGSGKLSDPGELERLLKSGKLKEATLLLGAAKEVARCDKGLEHELNRLIQPIACGQLAELDLLVRQGANVDRKLLLEYIEMGHPALLKYVLGKIKESRDEKTYQTWINEPCPDRNHSKGWTPLKAAIFWNCERFGLEKVKLLIREGAKVDAEAIDLAKRRSLYAEILKQEVHH